MPFITRRAFLWNLRICRIIRCISRISHAFSNAVHHLQDLKKVDLWSETRPMRVVTGYANIARRFFADHGFDHVVLLSGDGALEAAPAMGSADIILDLVSTGVTLRENNLREIEGGEVCLYTTQTAVLLASPQILDSQGVLVGNRRALLGRHGLLRIVRELLDRLDAHLKAKGYFSVIANMRGSSPEFVASHLAQSRQLSGLQGPTISPVYSPDGSNMHVYATCICVKKADLYSAVKEIRKVRSEQQAFGRGNEVSDLCSWEAVVSLFSQ